MRFELAGYSFFPDTKVFTFTENQEWDIQKYIDGGYNTFEVICIGGGGGAGGGVIHLPAVSTVREATSGYGGAGGGGGLHKVKGALSSLSNPVPIIVGLGGTCGYFQNGAGITDLTHIFDNLTDGGDGSASSFNDSTCKASGGKGGIKISSFDNSVKCTSDGGQGGLGNSVIPGGGGAGGVAGQNNDPSTADPSHIPPNVYNTPGTDGTWDGEIGAGGGGGAGGYISYFVTGPPTYSEYHALLVASAGGNGSYNGSDISAMGLSGSAVKDIPINTLYPLIPGFGGGASAISINSLPTIYGSAKSVDPNSISVSGPLDSGAGDPGIVVVKLTSE